MGGSLPRRGPRTDVRPTRERQLSSLGGRYRSGRASSGLGLESLSAGAPAELPMERGGMPGVFPE